MITGSDPSTSAHVEAIIQAL